MKLQDYLNENSKLKICKRSPLKDGYGIVSLDKITSWSWYSEYVHGVVNENDEIVMPFVENTTYCVFPEGNILKTQYKNVNRHEPPIYYVSHYHIEENSVVLKMATYDTHRPLIISDKTALLGFPCEAFSTRKQYAIYDIIKGQEASPRFDHIGNFQKLEESSEKVSLAEKYFNPNNGLSNSRLCVYLNKYGEFASPIYNTYNKRYYSSHESISIFNNIYENAIAEKRLDEESAKFDDFALLRQRIYK